MKHRIKEVRKEKGLTQAKLAERLEMTPQGVSFIENSDSVTLNTLEKVASALGCYAYELIATGEKDGLMTFDSGEAFDAYVDSLLKHNDDNRDFLDYMKRLREPASKLNDIGRDDLYNYAEYLTTKKELTR